MNSAKNCGKNRPRKAQNVARTKCKCQFCAAFFIDEISYEAHSEKCVARLSAFLATDGRIKFACMVCRDVFDAPNDLDQHERRHKHPGGFGCSVCNETFLREQDRVRHCEDVHQAFECLRCENGKTFSNAASYVEHCETEHQGGGGYAVCLECGAGFEEKTHLRFHSETECGRFRGWTCYHCAAIFPTELTLDEHLESHSPTEIKRELEHESIPAMEFAAIDITPMAETKELLYDPMEIDRSQYSDSENFQLPEEASIVVKEEMDETNNSISETEEAQDEVSAGDVNTTDGSEPEEDRRSDKKFSCKFCSSSFALKNTMKIHVYRNHRYEVKRRKNGRNNECEFCRRCYSAPEHLEKHVRLTHAKFECDKCGLCMMRKMDLHQHFASDCGRKPVNVCAVCQKSFDSAIELRKHRATHTADEFVCHTCNRTFDSYNQLRPHLRAHKGNDEWHKCNHCEKKFRQQTSLLSHMSKHTGVNPNQCTACGKRFLTLSKLLLHRKTRPKSCKLVPLQPAGQPKDAKSIATTIKLNVGKKRMNALEFVCSICHQEYAFQRHLERHMPVHGPDGKLVHKCECCPKLFATAEEKDEHKKENHLDEITCQHCKKVFINRNALRNHINNMHLKRTYARRHVCVKCGLACASKEFLENHEKSNCGENPIFKCEQCGKCLANKYTYRDHMMLHRDDSETKTFICTYCGKGWRTKFQLQSHIRFHTNDRPFKCDYCEKSFCDPTSKKTHESIHTGIKPYMCQCGDRFSCISNLQSHRRARKTSCGLLPLISKAFPQMAPENFEPVQK